MLPRSNYSPGDVLRYTPSGGMHARQGTAIVRPNGAALDTFWSESGDSESHRLTADELASAKVLFNVGDYEKIGTIGHCAPSDEAKWLEYHPDDRQRIGSQHEHCSVLYVRKGAKPDLSTKIENARQAVADAETHLDSAQHRLRWRQEDLAKLEAEAVGDRVPDDNQWEIEGDAGESASDV